MYTFAFLLLRAIGFEHKGLLLQRLFNSKNYFLTNKLLSEDQTKTIQFTPFFMYGTEPNKHNFQPKSLKTLYVCVPQTFTSSLNFCMPKDDFVLQSN